MRLLLVALLLLAGTGVWLYLHPEAAEPLKAWLPQPDFTKKTARIYKWQNDQGEWQLTDKPPPAGIEYEKQDYHEDLNTLPVPPGIKDKQ